MTDASTGDARALLDAVVAMTSDPDQHRVLQRIVDAACELAGARYGFLGIVDAAGSFSDYVLHGMTPEEIAAIPAFPRGLGILRVIIDEPAPLRLEHLAEHPEAFGFPGQHPPMDSFLGVPVRVGGEVFGNLYLTEKEGGATFTAADEQLVDALARAAGFVIDNARTLHRTERDRTWLAASAEVGEELAAGTEGEDAWGHLAVAARAAAGSRWALVVQAGDDGRHEVLTLDGDAVPDIARLLEDVGEPLARADAAGEVTAADHAGAPALVVPLQSRVADRSLLVLVWARGDRRPDADEVARTIGFAESVSLALDRAQALAERQELMLVADRDRIARDLHDIVIQRLFATGLALQGVRQMSSGEATRSRIDDAVADLDVTIRDIRSTIFELQHRRETSFRAEVRSLVKEYVPVLGFTPLVRTTGPVDAGLPDEEADHLLATLREALSNVARHADAGSCLVEVALRDEWLHLVVVDDGVGLSGDAPESGLRNARRRAADSGGRMRLGRAEPHGTRIEWSVPVATPDEAPNEA